MSKESFLNTFTVAANKKADELKTATRQKTDLLEKTAKNTAYRLHQKIMKNITDTKEKIDKTLSDGITQFKNSIGNTAMTNSQSAYPLPTTSRLDRTNMHSKVVYPMPNSSMGGNRRKTHKRKHRRKTHKRKHRRKTHKRKHRRKRKTHRRHH